MPSQRNILAKLDFGCTVRNIGTITVGPVTTTSAPNNMAIAQSNPSKKCAAGAIHAQVINAPMVTRWVTIRPCSLISLKLSVSAPSNRMTATPNEIIGNNKSPKISSGSNIPNPGPNSKPHNKSGKIAGRRNFQPTH